jgi:hypothetical protein
MKIEDHASPFPKENIQVNCIMDECPMKFGPFTKE